MPSTSTSKPSCGGLHIETSDFRFRANPFDPLAGPGPLKLNKLHINSIACNRHGMYIGGLRTGGMLHFNGSTVLMAAELPDGSHNAQPFRDGVLFNDNDARAAALLRPGRWRRGSGHGATELRFPPAASRRRP